MYYTVLLLYSDCYSSSIKFSNSYSYTSVSVFPGIPLVQSGPGRAVGRWRHTMYTIDGERMHNNVYIRMGGNNSITLMTLKSTRLWRSGIIKYSRTWWFPQPGRHCKAFHIRHAQRNATILPWGKMSMDPKYCAPEKKVKGKSRPLCSVSRFIVHRVFLNTVFNVMTCQPKSLVYRYSNDTRLVLC